jgi:dihydroxyacetone kinase-like predicted kinase
VEGEVTVIGHDLGQTCATLLDRLLGGGGELVTLVLGAHAPVDLGEQIVDHLRRAWPAIEVQTYHGGQPHHHLMIGVE